MPDLRRYHQKRDPERTPEPFGDEPVARAVAGGGPHVFVVQQHAARRMHWDLRLEIDGVLTSWAVPRGPSLDPAEKRLAVLTEDHPLEYADFEGIIPEGNYGAGAMIVWDRGTYHTADAQPPSAGVAQGKLDLLFQGHKLRGRFALVRTRGAQSNEWLLFRKGDPPAPGAVELVEAEPASVLSGLSISELRAGVQRDADLASAIQERDAPPLREDPLTLRPMLASRGERPFSRAGWLFELKHDGVRVLAHKLEEGSARVISRAGRDVTRIYPEVTRAIAHLPVASFSIDGEVVAFDAGGRSSFERLQRRFTQTDPEGVAEVQVEIPVLLFAFDLLVANGRDLRGLPLELRKRALERFVPRNGFVRFSDHLSEEGLALYEAAREHGFEGVIAKRADSRYLCGKRSAHWVKLKLPRTARFVIVGATPGRGARGSLGSLMVAWWRGGVLTYAGNVGSGLGEAVIEQLLGAFEALRAERPAFADPPEARGALYVRPELVCEVRYTEVTQAGLLRQPVFLRLAPETPVDECLAPAQSELAPVPPEPPPTQLAAPEPAPEALELSRLEKVFWPDEGLTKGDLLAYYEAVWPWLAPYLRDRPVVLVRYPDGIAGKHFYQKNVPSFTPSWARRQEIEGTDYFICNDLRTLLYVINSGAIPLHVWSARLGTLDRPDWLILDLDPKEAPFDDVITIAREARTLLADLGVEPFVKSSGQAGLHVMLPLASRLDHEEAKTLGEVLARVLCAQLPNLATVARPVAARADKVYIDYLQNGHGKLIVAPLSVRAVPGAPVSMPLRWSRVTRRLDPARFTLRTAVRALERDGDPLAGVLGASIDVDALLGALLERLQEKGGS
jgi:bifunctional non-homologous end joining protein LigD